VAPYLTELKRRSDTRVAVDRDFAYLREEIDRYKKAVAEKSVSLNEAQRLKEKNEVDARSKARKKDLASRPEAPGKVYEITLKNVGDAGLPSPVTKTNQVKKADSETKPDSAKKPKKEAGKKKTSESTSTADHPSSPDLASEDEEVIDDAPAVDITMDEAKRILMDYVYLVMKEHALAGPITTSTSAVDK